MAKKFTIILLIMFVFIPILNGCSKEDDFHYELEFDNEPLPSSFNLYDEGRMTPAKSQGSTGLCWAFGTLSTVESSILTSGLAKQNEIDLSEGALAYYMYPLLEDFENNGTGDGLYIKQGSPSVNFYMSCFYGGDPRLAFSMFANGEALINESISPISTDNVHLKKSLDNFMDAVNDGNIVRDSKEWLLTDWNTFDEASPEEMKRAIYKYGGLNAGIFCKLDGLVKHFDTGEPTSYYSGVDPNAVETNHCVVLIGWDDDYSRDNFGKCKPEHNGAWLALDSTDGLSDDSGLMYISYDDFIEGYWTTKMCLRNDYGDILHYDYCSLDALKINNNYTTVANIFTAPSNKNLKAIGATTLADNQYIEIKIFLNPSEKPDDGHLIFTQKECPHRKGYHVINLDKPVELSEGKTFSIVVTYYVDPNGGEQSGSAPVESEHFKDFEISPSLKYKSEFRITVHPGESFIIQDGKWHDLADKETAKLLGKDYPIGNIGIKALLEL